jgi:hypothetical protein
MVGRKLALVGTLALLVAAGGAVGEVTVPRPRRQKTQGALTLEQSLVKAQVGGKYRMLLHQLDVPQDLQSYTDFTDYGIYPATSYAGYDDLPAGYWVYVYPYWYLWRDASAEAKPRQPWSADQAAGPPDTPAAGEAPTAWESLTADDADEWLLLEYAELVLPLAVRIHETHNPGAVKRVTCFTLDGEEEELWAGKDPTTPDNEQGVSVIPCGVDFRTNRIKIYLDSRAVRGGNAIDAVAVVDGARKIHWAAAAAASSSRGMPPEPAADPNEERVRALEQEILRLQAELEEQRKK